MQHPLWHHMKHRCAKLSYKTGCSRSCVQHHLRSHAPQWNALFHLWPKAGRLLLPPAAVNPLKEGSSSPQSNPLIMCQPLSQILPDRGFKATGRLLFIVSPLPGTGFPPAPPPAPNISPPLPQLPLLDCKALPLKRCRSFPESQWQDTQQQQPAEPALYQEAAHASPGLNPSARLSQSGRMGSSSANPCAQMSLTWAQG